MTTTDQDLDALIADRVTRPDMEHVINQLRRARLHLRLALNSESALQAVVDMQRIVAGFRTTATRAAFRYSLNTRQEEKDYIFFREACVQFDHHLQQFYAALLSSRYRSDIQAVYGDYLFQIADAFIAVNQPELLEERLQEDRLIRRYTQLISSITVDWQGQKQSLPALSQALQDPDRAIRHQAHLALDEVMASRSSELDELLHELIQCRHSQASQSGYSSFAEMGYLRLGRFGCTLEHMKAVHEDVRRYIVPLTREIRHLQRRRLKLEHLFWYDLPCFFPEGNPPAALHGDELYQAIDDAIERLTESSSFSLREMVNQGLTDFQSKPGKIPENRCLFLPDEQQSFLLMQESGTSQDISQLLGLIGQAFAAHQLFQTDKPIDPLRPDTETQMLYRAVMPLLLMPLLRPVFDVYHDDFAAMYLTQVLLQLPQNALLDVFQHEIYRNPEMTPQQRNKLWRILEKKYIPDLDYEDAPYMNSGRAWQFAFSVIREPFLTGSMVLGQLSAMDLWRISLKNPARAQRHFLDLCSAGGSKDFFSLLEDEALSLPIDPDTIKKIAYAACDSLSL